VHDRADLQPTIDRNLMSEVSSQEPAWDENRPACFSRSCMEEANEVYHFENRLMDESLTLWIVDENREAFIEYVSY
jgi:hypothetical protein